MSTSHPLAKCLQAYFQRYMPEMEGSSPHTIISYRDALKLFIRFAAKRLKKSPDRLALEDLADRLIISFLDQLEKHRGNSPRTRNTRLAALRSFFHFVGLEYPELLEQCRKICLIRFKRTAHQTVEYLDSAEMKAMFDAVDASSRMARRDEALLLILYNTGARVEEVVNLTAQDLRLQPPSQVKLLGKGSKQRACPIWPETKVALEKYLAERQSGGEATQPLFLNARGAPISRFGVRYIVRTYAKKAAAKCESLREKSVGPHTFRHSTAMHLIQAGNDINLVRIWLGHAHISTTHAYLEIDMEMKRKMLETTDPPASSRKPGKTPQWQAPGILEWLDNLSEKVSGA